MANNKFNNHRSGNTGRGKRKTKTMLRKAKRKIGVVFFLVGFMFLILIGRIFLIHYTNGDKYSKTVLDHQQYTSTSIPDKRGEITDRNGTIMAYSERVYNLILDPKIVLSDDDYKQPTLDALVKYFNLNQSDLENTLASKSQSHYEKLLKDLTSDQVKDFKTLLTDKKNNPYINGVWLEDSYTRKYPFSTLASSVLGFASPVNGGEIGLENYYNEELSGTPGVSYGYMDEDLNQEQVRKEPVDGSNLVTTLDYSVQSILEKHIKAFNDEFGSKNTAAIVMNPNNGEILGMASYPVFDLNNPRDLSGVYSPEELAKMSDDDKNKALYELWRNYGVSTIYEPGSTFKPFTVSSALDENVISTQDHFFCKGYEEFPNTKPIKCWKTTGHGDETLEQTLMNSCNPAMMQIAAKLGPVKFADYQRRFGFGQKTGIDLPGEELGLLKPANMSAVDLAVNSFGQGFNVNMMQMMAGFASVINGGNYYQPHIAKKIVKENGELVKDIQPSLVKQTITKTTSDTLKGYLKSVVEDGTAAKVKVEGYSIGGKTGTAEKYPRGNGKYVISFMGFAPAENPKFQVYVVIDEPKVEEIGSSAPVLKLSHDILTDLLPYMNVYKDADEEPQDTSGAPVEAYTSSFQE